MIVIPCQDDVTDSLEDWHVNCTDKKSYYIKMTVSIANKSVKHLEHVRSEQYL